MRGSGVLLQGVGKVSRHDFEPVVSQIGGDIGRHWPGGKGRTWEGSPGGGDERAEGGMCKSDSRLSRLGSDTKQALQDARFRAQQTIPACAKRAFFVCTIQVGRVRILLSCTPIWNGKNGLKTSYSLPPSPKKFVQNEGDAFLRHMHHTYTYGSFDALTFEGYIEVPNATKVDGHFIRKHVEHSSIHIRRGNFYTNSMFFFQLPSCQL